MTRLLVKLSGGNRIQKVINTNLFSIIMKDGAEDGAITSLITC